MSLINYHLIMLNFVEDYTRFPHNKVTPSVIQLIEMSLNLYTLHVADAGANLNAGFPHQNRAAGTLIICLDSSTECEVIGSSTSTQWLSASPICCQVQ